MKLKVLEIIYVESSKPQYVSKKKAERMSGCIILKDNGINCLITYPSSLFVVVDISDVLQKIDCKGQFKAKLGVKSLSKKMANAIVKSAPEYIDIFSGKYGWFISEDCIASWVNRMQ